jgi:hypothetical protein
LADPSAPSMGSTNTMTSSVSDSNIDHNTNMTQSPITPLETSSYVPSPTTSTGFGYHNTSLPMSARSASAISENQQAVSPKPVYAQPHSPQQEYHHQQPQIMKPSPPKHQPTVKPSSPPQVVIQQCKFFFFFFFFFLQLGILSC